MPKGIRADLAGERFGTWTVLSRRDRYPQGRVMWNCVCDCGSEAVVSTGNLRQGKSKGCLSCGARKAHATRRAARSAPSQREGKA